MEKRTKIGWVGSAMRVHVRSAAMGEVRVKVKLTNAVDQTLAIEGRLPRKRVRSCIADALLDTGSFSTVLPVRMAKRLGLVTVGQRIAHYADGREEAVPLTSGVIVDWNGRDTLEEAVLLGDEVLVGQTFLESLNLQVDCRKRCIVPNPKHPDYPVIRV